MGEGHAGGVGMKQMRARRKTATFNGAALDAAFSRNVKERDGHRCRMERWDGSRYVEHGIKGDPCNPLDAAHIYGRPHLPPSIRFEAIVGLTACRDCHEEYDRHGDRVRVPLKREFTAFKAINMASKVGIARRLPPSRPLVREKAS